MADNVLVTAGAGTIIAADDINVGSPDLGPIYAQRVKVIWGPDGTGNDTDVASGKPLPVQLRTSAGTAMSFNTGAMDSGTQRIAIASDSPGVISTGTAGSASATVLTVQGVASMTAVAVSAASGAVASGAIASGAVASGAFASGSIASGAIASGAIAAGAIAAGATSIADNEDAASADADRGVKILAVRKATPANTSGTDGDYEFLQMSAGRIWATANIQYGGTAADLGSGTGGTATPRVFIDTAQTTLSVAQDVSRVANGISGTTLTPKFIKIAASSSGLNVVLAGVSSKKIRVLAGKMVANAAVNAKWQSQTASPDTQTDLTGLSYFGAQGDGEVLGYNPVGWFETATGEGLTLNLSSGVAVGGHLTYVEV